MSNSITQPLVSVVMITYGHEKFIREAVEGVLIQKTSFDVELIIADDCSPDDTKGVIQKLQKHPSNTGVLINYICHSENIGMMPNFIWSLKKARGKYIALCDGDDYWVDELKLQKQVAFLEKHQNAAFCFHRVYELHNESFNIDRLNSSELSRFYLKDILDRNYAHTPSIVFRASDFFPIPDFFLSSMPGDHTLQCLLLRDGKYGHFIDNCMAVYRKHRGGVWSSHGGEEFLYERAITKLKLLEFLKIDDKKFISIPFFMLADLISKEGYNKISFFGYQRLIFKFYGVKRFLRLKYIFFPRTYSFFRKVFGRE